MKRRVRRYTGTETLETRCLLSTITVTSLDDNMAADGEVTLREAIKAANDDVSVDGSIAGSGNDVIEFDPNLDGTITIAQGAFEITSNVQIVGNSVSKTIIDGESGGVFVLPNTGTSLGITKLRIVDAETGIEARQKESTVSVKTSEINRSELAIDVRGRQSSLTIDRSSIRANAKGVFVNNIESLTVVGSTFADNINPNGSGGAISAGADDVLIDRSTFHNNEAEWGGAISLGASSKTQVIQRSTFSGNQAERGAAIALFGHLSGGASLLLKDSTLLGNEGESSIRTSWFTYLRLENTIVMGTGAGDLDIDETRATVVAHNSLISNNRNSGLTASSSPNSNGSLIGTPNARIDPLLEPLADNGGPTLTHRPTASSPVIDLGATLLTTDQRGSNFGRIAGSAADMGAVEYWDTLVRVDMQTTSLTEGDQGATSVVAEVTLLGGATSVDYTTVDGTAVAGQDYTANSGTLNFSGPGDTKQIPISITGDLLAELDEVFTIDVQQSGVVALASNSRTEFTIENDDVGIVLDGTQVLVIGDQQDNILDVSVNGDDAMFDLDGFQASFPLTSVDSVYVDLFAGDDEVRASEVDLPFTVLSGSGADTVVTGSGDDTIKTGDGPDEVSAGAGNDSVLSGAGADTIMAGSGSDYVDAGDKKDSVVGGSGKDTLNGGDGNDTILGESGNDRIDGGRGRDRLWGDIGNDTITGGRNDDYIQGGEGDDQLDVEESRGNDKIFGGPGNDQVSTPVSSVLSGKDSVLGGSGDDTLLLGANDYVNGGSGNDQIHAGTAFGASGSDVIFGWTVRGGSGPDRIFDGNFGSASPNRFVAYGEGGNDTIGHTSRKESVIYGGAGNDTLSGDSASDSIYGGSGNDRIFGDSGNDLLIGGEGNDRLHGGFHDDVLLGGNGNDILRGDQNNDIAIGGTGADVFYGDNHEDLLVSGSTTLSIGDVQLVHDEWIADRPLDERVDNIRDGSGASQGNNGTVFFSAGQTILDDADVDLMDGADGLDWFFANQSADTINDFASGEFMDAL